MLADVRRRLRIACLACFFAMLVTLLAHFWLVRIGWDRELVRPHVIACAVSMAVSLALYFVFGLRRLKPEWLLNLGAVAAWQLCFSLSMMELKGPDSRLPGDQFGSSLVCVVIVLVPILIPAPPWKTLLWSLLFATTGPLAFTGVRQHPGFDWVHPTLERYFNLYALNYVAAGLALAPAFVLGQLREELKEARELGSYKLLEKLGQGGMGEVWKARHNLLARPAAIKLILTPDPVMLKRFEQEVQATARLTSPHTVTVFDYGIGGDGRFYYVMELLEGLDAAELVKAHGPLPAGRVVQLLAQVLESLEEAHRAGLVHRDIKPENIFVCQLGGRGDFVKVLDFGLALSVSLPEEARLSMANSVTGTPSYMAPEQALEKPLDGRADLYAVGCLGYWLLTGTTVFTSDNPVQQIISHASLPPDPPSARVADVPPELEAIILECLAKEPEERPASAAILRARLLECGGAPWTQAQADEWWDLSRPRA